MIRELFKKNLKQYTGRYIYFTVINIILSPIYLFGGLATVFPVTAICVISILFNKNIALLKPAILIFFTEWMVFMFSVVFAIYKESISLEDYLEELISNNLSIVEIESNELLNDIQKEIIELQFQSKENAGRIFSLSTTSNVINSQMKGFTFPYFPGLSDKIKINYSCIFLNVNSNGGIIDQFYLAHEIGHMRLANTMIVPKLIHNTFGGLFLIVLLLFSFSFSYSALFFIPFVLWLLKPITLLNQLEAREEELCDSFSIKVLSRSKGYPFERLYSLLKRIFPTPRLINIKDSIGDVTPDIIPDFPEIEIAKLFNYHWSDDFFVYIIVISGSIGLIKITLWPIIVALIVWTIICSTAFLIVGARFKTIDSLFEKLQDMSK